MATSTAKLNLNGGYCFVQNNDLKHSAVVVKEKSVATSSPESRAQSHRTPVGLYGDEVLQERKVNSKHVVKVALHEIWANIPPELTQNLVHSMNKQLRTMIECKGAHKKY